MMKRSLIRSITCFCCCLWLFLLLIGLLLQEADASSASSSCGRDSDCNSVAPHGRVVCRRHECSCKQGFVELHKFDAETGVKTEVLCYWPTPLWFWIVTHLIALVSPFILAGLMYLIVGACQDSCREQSDPASPSETVPLAGERRRK